MIRVFLVALALCAALAAPAHAVRPDEMLKNPKLEARAEQVGRELRCLVCRNQSIEDSQAELAHDLRVLVRRRITAGDSNRQVIAYIRSRYGDYVLLDPPFEWSTLLLWIGPGVVLLLGALALLRFFRRRGDSAPRPLNPAERRRLAALLADGEKP